MFFYRDVAIKAKNPEELATQKCPICSSEEFKKDRLIPIRYDIDTLILFVFLTGIFMVLWTLLLCKLDAHISIDYLGFCSYSTACWIFFGILLALSVPPAFALVLIFIKINYRVKDYQAISGLVCQRCGNAFLAVVGEGTLDDEESEDEDESDVEEDTDSNNIL